MGHCQSQHSRSGRGVNVRCGRGLAIGPAARRGALDEAAGGRRVAPTLVLSPTVTRRETGRTGSGEIYTNAQMLETPPGSAIFRHAFRRAVAD